MEEEKSENLSQENALENKTQSENNVVAKSSFLRGRLLIALLVGAVALIVLLLLGLNILSSKNNTTAGKTPPKEPENVLLATVGEQMIYRNDVKKIALEQYLGSAITNSVIKSSLNVAVERALLDKEAREKKIVIEPQKDQAKYYQLLKEKVVEGQVLSVTEQDISWWIPPVPYEQKPEFQIQRQNQDAMASAIEKRLRAGEEPFAVAQDMTTKYPMFAQTLGFNGGIVSKITNPSFGAPRTLEYNTQDAEKPFFKMLYSMRIGEVRKGIWGDGSGGAVIKVSNLVRGKNIDYQEWLNNNIKKSVVFNTAETTKL